MNKNMNVEVNDGNAEIVDLTLGKRTLNFVGEDLFFKLTKEESKPVSIESAPVFFTGADGKLYDTHRYKVGIRNNQLAGIVSSKYTFISNEKVYQLIRDAGFQTPEKVEFAHNGNVMFATVFSDKTGDGAHVWSND